MPECELEMPTHLAMFVYILLIIIDICQQT